MKTKSVKTAETPRTDSMCKAIRSMSESARSRNLAYLCRKLERELSDANRRVQRGTSQKPKLPNSLFDTYAVWTEVFSRAPQTTTITPAQVADVLDAVVAMERKAAKQK